MGSFAYRVYHNLNEDFVYSGTLNIAPNEDTILFKDFVELQKVDDKIKINLLVDSYFDSKNFKSQESKNFNGSIIVQSGKLNIAE